MLRNNLFIIVFSIGFFILGGCVKQNSGTNVESQEAKAERADAGELNKREIELLLKSLKKKNPFRPDHATGVMIEVEQTSELKGIIWDESHPYALIGERVVVVGDSIDNKKVIKINKDSVVLDSAGVNEVLRIEE